MDDQPIAVFDSGIGGLTAFKVLCELMPYEDIIYFADTNRMPYGNKDENTIIKYTKEILNFLKSFKVKASLAACGTISSHLKFIDSQVFGVIKSSCEAAVKITKNKRIGILATTATVKMKQYVKNINDIDKNILCFQQACPKLAFLIENGHIDKKDRILRNALIQYISPIVEKNVDTIILGCTHYPIISDAIKDIFGENLNLINTGEETAKSLKIFLEDSNLKSSKKSFGTHKFFISGEKELFAKNAKIFLDKDILPEIEVVKIS